LKKLTILILCSFAWIVFLKEDAQIGIFKNVPVIEVVTGFFTRTERKSTRIVFTYKGQIISLPFSSIAYWTNSNNPIHSDPHPQADSGR